MKVIIRFISLGSLNTLATIGIYQIFLFFFTPSMSYLLSWSFGFVVLTIFYPTYVFGVDLTIESVIKIIIIYLSSLFIGTQVTSYLSALEFNSRLAIFLVIVITTIFNFTLMKVALNRK